MKKLNSKAFTLIELLAVITIMGILMIVAVPAISRTIENTRRDSFLDTAKQYANGVKTMWVSDSLQCGSYLSTAAPAGKYYVPIDSAKAGTTVSGVNYPKILEQGGKSSWSNLDTTGYVLVTVTGTGSSQKVVYSVALRDSSSHGIAANTKDYLDLKRADVSVSGVARHSNPSGATVCVEV